jgi:NADP-dependent 3-hydroxy acid dehydrogenase YdfG
VTGSASGLGRNIPEAVLAAGDLLIATAREPRRLDDLVQKHGESIRTASLDVADEEAAKATVQAAVAAFGRLDVVVNNAGYGDVAPFEQLSSDRFRAVIDTNFHGVVNVTRAALPIMRKQKSGYIFHSVGATIKALRPLWGHENSDPAKVAQVILRLASSDQLPPHLLLGSDAIQYVAQAEAARVADAERWRQISVSTDADATETSGSAAATAR